MNFESAKRFFFKILIACLVAAASLAVVTILVGHFSDTLEKALLTIFLIAAHALISFGFISTNEKQDVLEDLKIFTNATFGVIVLSFITSIFGVWHIISADMVSKLYLVYFVLLFATLHAEILSKIVKIQSNLAKYVISNYLFMFVVVVMLMPVIFVNDKSSLGSFYYRLLAASGIIDATLSMVTIILHKLYLQKNPLTKDLAFSAPQALGGTAMGVGAQQTVAPQKRGMNIFVKILIAYITLQILGALFVGAFGGFK